MKYYGNLVHKIRSSKCSKEYFSYSRLEKLNRNWIQAQNFNFYQDIKKKHKLPIRFNSLAQFVNNFPVITKSMLVEAFESESLLKNQKSWIYTSGSTGRSFGFPIQKKCKYYLYLQASLARQVFDINPINPYIQLWGNSFKTNKNNFNFQKVKRKIMDIIVGNYRFDSYHLNSQNFENILKKMNSLDEYIFYSYTSAAYLFAKYIEKNGKSVISKPNQIILSSEHTTQKDINYISGVFDSNVITEYGLVETGPVAFKNFNSNAYIVDKRFSLVNIINGEIVITNLLPRFFPFMNYSSNDLCSNDNLNSKDVLHISNIKGRKSEIFEYIKNDGNFDKAHSELISHSLKYFSEIEGFQCTTKSGVLTKLVLQTDLEKINLKQFRSKVYQSLLNHVSDINFEKLTLEFTPQLVRNKSGKVKVFIKD